MTRRGSGGGTWRKSASQHGRPTEVRESLGERAEVCVGGANSTKEAG